MPGISFDRAVEYYDATRGYAEGVAERIRDAIVKETEADQNTRFLELGVGTGRIALPFIQAGYDYTGIDLSQPMMDKLEQKLTEDPAKANFRYKLQQGDVTSLPFPDNSFDVIITVHVLHLIDNWQEAINEARRVLRKPGGKFILGYDDISSSSADQERMALQVRKRWTAIIEELGYKDANTLRRPTIYGPESQTTLYLKSIGATTQVVELAEYQTPPISPRDMFERLKLRMYSRDWKTPDEIHAEAVSRLEKWLNEEFADPDRKVSATAHFEAIIASWD